MPAHPDSSQLNSGTRQATGRAQGGDAAFFTEESLLRLEEGLCAQREREQQERRHFSEPDAASSPPGSSGSGAHGHGVQIVDPAEQIFRYRAPVPRYADDVALERGSSTRPSIEGPCLQLPDEIARRRSPYWRWLKVDLLLCALLLIVGATTVGVSLQARTGGSTDAARVNIEGRGRTASTPPNNDEPHQPIINAGKSSAATPSLPPNNDEPHQPIINAGKSSAATPSLPPNNDEPHQPIINAGKSSAAMPSLPQLPRHRPKGRHAAKGARTAR